MPNHHDSLRAVLLVNAELGGMTPPAPDARTVLWRWTGGRWVVLDSAGPPVRNLGGVAYDQRRNRLVLYGGSYSLDRVYGDTWEWSPADGWVEHRVSGPGPRDHLQMAYDAGRGLVILVGGQASLDSFPADVWGWNGVRWSRLGAGPAGGIIHGALAYDRTAGRVVLFGGQNPRSRRALGELLAWSGSEWVRASPMIQPRTHAALAWTPEGLILAGGLRRDDRNLRLEKGQWRVLQKVGEPPARYLPGLAYDAGRGVTVLYGGGDPGSDRLLADTWEFTPATGWREFR